MCKKFVPMYVDFDASNPDNEDQFSKLREKTTQTFNAMGTKKGGAIISGITVDNSDNHKVVIHISGKATKDQANWVKSHLRNG